MLYFQITDPFKSVYEIDNLPNAIEKLTQTTLRNVIGELELDETLTSRDTINQKLRLVLDEATNKWGVKIIRQSETKIIERLGRYHSTLESGINIIWPILDRPRQVYVRQTVKGPRGDFAIVKMSDVIDLREQVYDLSLIHI